MLIRNWGTEGREPGNEKEKHRTGRKTRQFPDKGEKGAGIGAEVACWGKHPYYGSGHGKRSLNKKGKKGNSGGGV